MFQLDMYTSYVSTNRYGCRNEMEDYYVSKYIQIDIKHNC